MNYQKKLNCKTCRYEYCPFRGSNREISAYFCEDYKPAEEGGRELPKEEEGK